ncbi:(2Fe-2S)-binding protein [Microbacteriaceae bacterium 4G12]
MASRMFPSRDDRIQPAEAPPVALTIDGERVSGLRGQTIAGVLLASGRLSWRTTSAGATPRGVFCGIGVCFDCIVTVNGDRDVRACQRRADDGDVILTQHDELPGRDELPGAAS